MEKAGLLGEGAERVGAQDSRSRVAKKPDLREGEHAHAASVWRSAYSTASICFARARPPEPWAPKQPPRPGAA